MNSKIDIINKINMMKRELHQLIEDLYQIEQKLTGINHHPLKINEVHKDDDNLECD